MPVTAGIPARAKMPTRKGTQATEGTPTGISETLEKLGTLATAETSCTSCQQQEHQR